MVKVAIEQLRHRLGRTLALLVGIAVATTSFTVLTGAAETTRLQVRGTVAANFRSTYDLLVRPRSSYTALERSDGLVRPNYQSGIFGGITTSDYATIRRIPGVDVAAPIANIGYVPLPVDIVVPMRHLLDNEAQQLFRVRPVWTDDRRTSRFVGTPIYVYVSRNPVRRLPGVPYTRGGAYFRASPTYAEVVPGRHKPVPVCTDYAVDQEATGKVSGRFSSPFGYRDPYARSAAVIYCYYTRIPHPDELTSQGASAVSQLGVAIPMSVPVLLAAVDPDAEARLSGLDDAVVSGSPLTEGDRPTKGAHGPVIPVLATSHVDIDESVSATVERVEPPAGGHVTDAFTGQRGVLARVAALSGVTIAHFGPVLASKAYTHDVTVQGSTVEGYWQVGSSTYDPGTDDPGTDDPGTDQRGGSAALVVRAVVNRASAYDLVMAQGTPIGSDDQAVRRVVGHPLRDDPPAFPQLQVVGRYDPDKVLSPRRVSGLTAATYVSPTLPGADAASRRVLRGGGLAPGTNVGGYAAQPPALLTTLAGATPLLNRRLYEHASSRAPISVIRVRVKGVDGPDPVSRARLDQVALAITHRTGLAVDIVAGASGQPTTVVLPAGRHGRPELRLSENWARKGVAYQVISAVDAKSLALFLLILAVCVLVVGTAASAAVRTRRSELGVLACLGWGTGRIFGVVIIELAVTGLLAGVVGTVVAWPLSDAVGSSISVSRAALAVPAAVVLAALAGLVPAIQAARSRPLDAIRPVVHAPRRARPVRSMAGLVVLNLRRTPGRTALGSASLAIGVSALTTMLAVQGVFRGVVVGSILGNAVTVQVRTPDVVALVAILALATAGVADVLYLVVREQSPELAVLRATGWTEGAVTRLLIGQGVGIGVLGGSTGAIAGCLAVSAFVRSASMNLWLPGIGAALIGVGVAALAALVPAVLARRLQISALVSEEA